MQRHVRRLRNLADRIEGRAEILLPLDDGGVRDESTHRHMGFGSGTHRITKVLLQLRIPRTVDVVDVRQKSMPLDGLQGPCARETDGNDIAGKIRSSSTITLICYRL